MKQWIKWMVTCSIGFTAAVGAFSQTFDFSSTDSVDQTTAGGLRRLLSDKPFFGTASVLTLNGSYVNTPKEDFEQTGTWTLPLSLDEMHGMIAEISFGDVNKQGQWQLTYRYKVMTMDGEWQTIADSSGGLSLSDRRSQVLKASYNVRDWWKVGIGAFVEDRSGVDPTVDPGTLGLNGQESLGFQIDTLLKF